MKVDAGIFRTNEQVDLPTRAVPLLVVISSVPVPEALFAATYAASAPVFPLAEVKEKELLKLPLIFV